MIDMFRQALYSKTVWLSYLVHTVVVLISAVLAAQFLHPKPSGFINHSLNDSIPIIGNFLRWDAHWYTYIAENGYDTHTIVFFPVIIIVIKLVSYLGISYGLAGFLVCNLFTMLSYALMYSLFRLDLSERETGKALLAYAVFPTSVFLNSVYTEPFFLVFSLASLYFLRAGKWWSAGIFATLATLTRNLGIFLVFYMLYEAVKMYRKERKLKLPMFSLLLTPLALLMFMVYNYALLGNPLAFINSQKEWGREFGFPWMNIWNNVLLLFSNVPHATAGAILDLIMVVCFLGILLFLTFTNTIRMPRAYLIIGWIWFLIPFFSTTPLHPLYSMSRFLLVVFPIYLFFTRMPSKLYYGYILVSAAFLSICTALFTNWYWIG